MIWAFLFLSGGIWWLIRQYQEPRVSAWQARRQAVIDNPFRKNLSADIRATYRYASTWRVRYRDRREMKRLKGQFDQL